MQDAPVSRRAAPDGSRAPQNSRKAPGRPWLPGQSGNPGGRPKGLAVLSQAIVAQTEDGRELVQWYLGIFRGEGKPLGKKPTEAQRFEAAAWLTERGWGRPPQQLDVTQEAVTIIVTDGWRVG
jgi:hypothetical protein